MFRCNCGNIASGVRVGTTSHGHLLAQWQCGACATDVCALIDFEKLIAGIPPPPEPPEPADTGFTEEDRQFLRSGNVSLEKGEET